MTSNFSIPLPRPLLTLTVLVGLTFCLSVAHAQCGKMTPRTAIAWTALPDNTAPHFRPAARTDITDPTAHAGDNQIVGLWKVTFSSGGQVVDQAFETFHSDGTEIMVDTAPPASGNVCTGVWERAQGLTFRLNHPSWTFDDQGNVNGTAIIRLTVVVTPNGNNFSGTFTVDVLNTAGTVLEHLNGTVAAQRVSVD